MNKYPNIFVLGKCHKYEYKENLMAILFKYWNIRIFVLMTGCPSNSLFWINSKKKWWWQTNWVAQFDQNGTIYIYSINVVYFIRQDNSDLGGSDLPESALSFNPKATGS